MTKATDEGIEPRRSALTKDEVGEQLPDREQMSLINANIAAPVNLALAANIMSDNSIAYANAQQVAPISQTNP